MSSWILCAASLELELPDRCATCMLPVNLQHVAVWGGCTVGDWASPVFVALLVYASMLCSLLVKMDLCVLADPGTVLLAGAW